MRGCAAVLLSAVVAGLGAAAAFPQTYPGFKPRPDFGTPGQAAYCYTAYAGSEDDRAKLFCWTPRNGWSASIEWNGQRARTRIYDTFPQVVHGMTKLKGYAPRARVLRFGRYWRLRCGDPGDFGTCNGRGIAAFRCASARRGLTCRNAAGHGFWIGRQRGHRVF